MGRQEGRAGRRDLALGARDRDDRRRAIAPAVTRYSRVGSRPRGASSSPSRPESRCSDFEIRWRPDHGPPTIPSWARCSTSRPEPRANRIVHSPGWAHPPGWLAGCCSSSPRPIPTRSRACREGQMRWPRSCRRARSWRSRPDNRDAARQMRSRPGWFDHARSRTSTPRSTRRPKIVSSSSLPGRRTPLTPRSASDIEILPFATANVGIPGRHPRRR